MTTTSTAPGIVVSADDMLIVPYHWMRVVRSLQAAAKSATKTASGRTHAVITLHLVVNHNGEPIHWLKPRFGRLEPRSGGQALELLLETLAR